MTYSSPSFSTRPQPLLGVPMGGPRRHEFVSGSYISTEHRGFQASQPPTTQILPRKLVTALCDRPGEQQKQVLYVVDYLSRIAGNSKSQISDECNVANANISGVTPPVCHKAECGVDTGAASQRSEPTRVKRGDPFPLGVVLVEDEAVLIAGLAVGAANAVDAAVQVAQACEKRRKG